VNDETPSESRPSVGYVRLTGELDHITVPRYEGAAISAARTAEAVVTVDVGAVTFIDSAGLGLLADVLAIGTARGRAVTLQGASTDLHRLLLACGLESLFSYR
jgi:anti-sigma B factor antagonist